MGYDYYCKDCGHMFDRPKCYSDDCGNWVVCPKCESTGIEETEPCSECGIKMPRHDLFDSYETPDEEVWLDECLCEDCLEYKYLYDLQRTR